MPEKWAIGLAVEGDLRFLSHHDMMRLMERLLTKADLPLRFSQGFNPRPILSLVAPRPVGVGSTCDLLTVSLDSPPADDFLHSLNAVAPQGLRFIQAGATVKKAPQPLLADYELRLTPEQIPAVTDRLAELENEPAWPIERTSGKARRTSKTIDLKPLVHSMAISADVLHVQLQPEGDRWAKPAELMRLLGLDERGDLARLTRTAMQWANLGSPQDASPARRRDAEQD